MSNFEDDDENFDEPVEKDDIQELLEDDYRQRVRDWEREVGIN